MAKKDDIYLAVNQVCLAGSLEYVLALSMYCKYCQQNQPDELFRKGSRKCKPCQAAYSDFWRKSNPEKAKESRQRFIDTHREHIRAYNRKRWKEKVPYSKQYRLERNASALANHAARTGKIQKATECQRCGRKAWLVGHHRDYLKPLEVEWICQICHRKEHINNPVTGARPPLPGGIRRKPRTFRGQQHSS